MQASLDLAEVGVGQAGHLGELAEREVGPLTLLTDEGAERFPLGLPQVGHGPPPCSQTMVRGSTGLPVLPRTDPAREKRRGLLGGVAGEQRGRGLQGLDGELALAGQQLLGELVAVVHDLVRLGEPVDQRHGERGNRGGEGLDGVDPGLDRAERDLLALADGGQESVLQVLRNGAGAGHDLCLLVGFYC